MYSVFLCLRHRIVSSTVVGEMLYVLILRTYNIYLHACMCRRSRWARWQGGNPLPLPMHIENSISQKRKWLKRSCNLNDFILHCHTCTSYIHTRLIYCCTGMNNMYLVVDSIGSSTFLSITLVRYNIYFEVATVRVYRCRLVSQSVTTYDRICISIGWRISTDTGCTESIMTLGGKKVLMWRQHYYILPSSLFFFRLVFSIPFIVFALLFSLPPSRNSDPGSHNRLFSPHTHYGPCLAFLSREDFSSFSLVDSRGIALAHARRSQQLILFLQSFFFANIFKI